MPDLATRDRIIEVALEAFRTDGLDVSMREIARRANLGVATIYRNFDSREALIMAVVQLGVTDLERLVEDVLAGPPEGALARLFAGKVAISSRSRGLTAAIGTWPMPPALAEPLTRALRAALDQLATQLHRTGELRPEISGKDLYTLVISTSYIAELSTDQESYRYGEVFARGLRP